MNEWTRQRKNPCSVEATDNISKISANDSHYNANEAYNQNIELAIAGKNAGYNQRRGSRQRNAKRFSKNETAHSKVADLIKNCNRNLRYNVLVVRLGRRLTLLSHEACGLSSHN